MPHEGVDRDRRESTLRGFQKSCLGCLKILAREAVMDAADFFMVANQLIILLADLCRAIGDTVSDLTGWGIEPKTYLTDSYVFDHCINLLLIGLNLT